MKLSNLPYLVQKEILLNIQYSDLIMLSFASKNVKKIIKSSQITRFKSISSIVYNYFLMGPEMVYIPSKTKRDFIMGMKNRNFLNNTCFPLNVSGKIIAFELCTRYRCPVASYQLDDKESVLESIHNYFLDLFGSSVEYHLKAGYGWRDNDDRIPNLQNLSVCSIRNSRFANMTNLQNFLASNLVSKRIYMVDKGEDSFDPESKFYQTESIEGELSASATLRHFQGRQAVVTCH
ncbi:hypothetical protein B9Z55_000626 [Caenorhabditis nigoni]|uniref:F-box domain-containing protein n=2 Tax=Caenorhabditis nigoni TaxID=1611254 RepID=A0A2G5VUP4_9PELO|nr:hypothetical protein B9Z55_000626 [Caenorhabditis nigoni]